MAEPRIYGERRGAPRRGAEVRKPTLIPHGVNPLTSNRIYDADESEFLAAVDSYKRRYNRQFPTYSEILNILKDLGWRKG